MADASAKKPRSKKPPAPRALLTKLRRLTKNGPVTVNSYPDLAERLKYDRGKLWEHVQNWERTGQVITEKDGKRLTSIHAPPDTSRGAGTGVTKPPRQKSPRKKAMKSVPKSDGDGVPISDVADVPETVAVRVRKRASDDVLKSGAPDIPIADGAASRLFEIDPNKSTTYRDHPAETIPPEDTPSTTPPSAENTSATKAEIPPPPPLSNTTTGDHSVGLFSLFSSAKKAPPKPTTEAPPRAPEPAADVPTGSVPQKVEASVPKPYTERPTWRIWRRPGRAVERPSEPKPAIVTVMPPRRRAPWSFPLWIIAYAFLGLSLWINVWNARNSSGDWIDMIIPAGTGILTELAMFFLPARIMVVPWPRKFLGAGLLSIAIAFALYNSLRSTSLLETDQAMGRGDRQTVGVQAANSALERARTQRAVACRRGQDKTKACRDAEDDVKKEETKQIKAITAVASTSKPVDADFSALVTWASRGAVQPGPHDFTMFWLLFRTVLPQVGGLILVMSRR
jgi:hypothetical protein